MSEEDFNRFYKRAINGKKGNLFTRVEKLEEERRKAGVFDITNIVNSIVTNSGLGGDVISDSASSVDDNIATYNGIDGKHIQDSGIAITNVLVNETSSLADGAYVGDSFAAVAGAALAFGNLCYFQTSDSRWELVDASAEATCKNRLGICVLLATGDGESTRILARGNVRADAAFPSMTVGVPIYASITAGEMSETPPSSNAGEIIRVIGTANTANELHFEPDDNFFEIGTPVDMPAAGLDTQVQYNDGGVLAGDANFTWDKTAQTMTLASAGFAIQGVADGGMAGLLMNGGTPTTADTAGGASGIKGGSGTGTGDGGIAGLVGGDADLTGKGGGAGLQGGQGGATSGDGGGIELTGGAALTDGDGGSITLTPGTGAGVGHVDGKVLVTGNTELTGSLLVSVPTGYAEMYMYANATACVINTANIYHAIYNTFGNNDGTLAPQLDATHFTYKAGVGYTIAAFANYNSPTNTQTKVTITAGHALLAGEPITISGTTNYNGTYVVLAAGLSATEFVVTKTYVANDATGSARRPATLKCLLAGKYMAGFTFSGIAANNNDVFKWELNKDDIPLDNIGARAIWTSGASNYRSVASTGLVSLTAGQYLWASVKNYSGANNVTFYSGNVWINRLK
jgi:hypothetical protein